MNPWLKSKLDHWILEGRPSRVSYTILGFEIVEGRSYGNSCSCCSPPDSDHLRVEYELVSRRGKPRKETLRINSDDMRSLLDNLLNDALGIPGE